MKLILRHNPAENSPTLWQRFRQSISKRKKATFLEVDWKKLGKPKSAFTLVEKSEMLQLFGKQCKVTASRSIIGKVIEVEAQNVPLFDKTKVMQLVEGLVKKTHQDPEEIHFRRQYAGIIKTSSGNVFVKGYYYPDDHMISMRIHPISFAGPKAQHTVRLDISLGQRDLNDAITILDSSSRNMQPISDFVKSLILP